MRGKKLLPTREAIAIALGKVIHEKRMQSGMTLADLDRICLINERHLSNLERGERTMSVYTLFRVAYGLGVSVAYILKRTEALL
jgi:transcriptional regulator with XRE-family HTH domain